MYLAKHEAYGYMYSAKHEDYIFSQFQGLNNQSYMIMGIYIVIENYLVKIQSLTRYTMNFTV